MFQAGEEMANFFQKEKWSVFLNDFKREFMEKNI
jgi:hypothetical protein